MADIMARFYCRENYADFRKIVLEKPSFLISVQIIFKKKKNQERKCMKDSIEGSFYTKN